MARARSSPPCRIHRHNHRRERAGPERHLSAVAEQLPMGVNSAERKRLEQLRAVVATSARYGAFRIEGDKGKRSMRPPDSGSIRILRASIRRSGSMPPTPMPMPSDRRREVGAIFHPWRSGRRSVRHRPGRGHLSGQRIEHPTCRAFLPHADAGLAVARVKEVRLSPSRSTGARRLRPALWTTFGPAEWI